MNEVPNMPTPTIRLVYGTTSLLPARHGVNKSLGTPLNASSIILVVTTVDAQSLNTAFPFRHAFKHKLYREQSDNACSLCNMCRQKCKNSTFLVNVNV